jgi:hypothetical protein
MYKIAVKVAVILVLGALGVVLIYSTIAPLGLPCTLFHYSMTVEAGRLRDCISQYGMRDFVNVRRLDGTMANRPDDLRLLVRDYISLEAAVNDSRLIDGPAAERLKAELRRYHEMDFQAMYEHLNQ